MRRVNIRLLMLLVAITVMATAGIYFLQRYQVRRNAGNLAELAQLRLSEGKNSEALNLFRRYLGFRPDDHAVYAEYAQLVLIRARSPEATSNDVARAFSTLETAVRRNPADDGLRQQLAQFQLQIGRFSDSRQHLVLLRKKALEPLLPADASNQSTDTPPKTAAKTAADKAPLNVSAIDVMLIQSYIGTGDLEQAATIASDLIGFDMKTKTFDPEKKSVPNTTDAYILLAAILEDKFKDAASATLVLQQLVTANADDALAWLALARRNGQRNDLKLAATQAAKAMQLAPDNPDALALSFEIASLDKNLILAETLAENGLELFPLDDRSYRNAATIALRKQQLSAAIEVLEKGLEKLPGKVSLLLLLADVQLQQRQLSAVEQTIAKLSDVIGPSSPAVGLLQARVFILEQQWLPAKLKLDQVRPMVAGSKDLTRQVDLCLGQCYEQLGQFDEQLSANQRVLTEDSSSLAARVGSAAALITAGKSVEALAEFEAIAASIPAEQLAAIPQIWNPLLQLRIANEMKRPQAERDWTNTDELIDQLQQSTEISDTQLTLLRIDMLVRKGEAEAAADFLEKQVKNNPADAQLWSALAMLSLREKSVTAAREVMDGIPQELSNEPEVLFINAQIAAREPAEEASKRLEQIEKQVLLLPTDQAVRLLSGLSSIRMSMGDYENAERLLRVVLEKTPLDFRVHVTLFELARDSGNIEKALAATKEIAALAGVNDPQTRLCEATVRVLKVRDLQKKQALAAADTSLLSEQSILDLNEARNLLIEAENDRSGWWQIQHLFAEIDLLVGDVPAAIERLRRAVKLGPVKPTVIRQLIALLYASNRLNETQDALNLLGPEGLAGFDHISAEMEMRSGKFDSAVTLAERSVAPDSKNPADLLWLGQLLSQSGKVEEANTALERAVESAPEEPETWLCLFSHQLTNGKRKAAEQVLRRAAEKLPADKSPLLIAQGSEMLGKLDDAEKSYREAVALAPDDLTIARGLAAFLVRRGRLIPAREELEKIVAAKTDKANFQSAQIWARRSLAELVAQNGGYNSLEKALSILDLNVGRDGKILSEDVALKIVLLTNRPEPVSWRKAVELLEKLAITQPLSTSQRIQLAQLLDRAGRWEECREDFISLVATPNTPPALFAILVEKLIDHGEYSSAKIWLEKLIALSPDASVTLALTSRLALAENDRATAVTAAKKLMPAGPLPQEQLGQLLMIARLMEDLQFPKAADKLLADFAARSTDGVIARAEFLGRHNRVDEGLDLLEQAWDRLSLELVLQTALTIVRAQGTALSESATTRIEPWFTKARREDPESVGLSLLLAELRELQGRSAEVETLYRETLARKDLAPAQAAIVANNLAFYLARPETAAEAKKLIDGAISELGPHPDLLDTRGMIYLSAGDSKRSLEDLQEAILAPSAIKFLHLACAQVDAKQNEAAKRALEKAKKLGLDAKQLSPVEQARLNRVERQIEAPPAGV